MQRLTGLDAGFLYMETANSAMHVAGLAIFDPSTAPGGWSVEKYKAMVRSRLHLAPPFRRRLVEVPFQLHHPLWIEDPDFDLDWHIRHIAVPAPGGPSELAELASHLVSLQLDRSRPLWEIWLIDGLENGNIATLSKVHHAAIDGASGTELTVNLFDLSPEIAEVPPPEKPWVPDRLPTDGELVSYALASLARQPVAAVKAVRRTASAAITLRRTNRQPDITPPPSPFRSPRTSINRPLTPRRSYAMTTASLADVKAVKNAFGTTVNDVILAVCAGALRRYFDAHDETFDSPLVAMVPVSVRSEEEKGAMGNRVVPSLTSLATDVDDPVERLLSIHGAMKRTKDQTNAIGADTLTNWAEFAAPMVFSRATRLYSNMKIAGRHSPLFNVTISNVPGPPFPLYVAGAQLLANYPVGPIFDGGGLNMTVMSYQDKLDFGLLACPDVVDDVWTIATALNDALDELSKAAKAKVGTVDAGPSAASDTSSAAPVTDDGRSPTATAPDAAERAAATDAPDLPQPIAADTSVERAIATGLTAPSSPPTDAITAEKLRPTTSPATTAPAANAPATKAAAKRTPATKKATPKAKAAPDSRSTGTTPPTGTTAKKPSTTTNPTAGPAPAKKAPAKKAPAKKSPKASSTRT